MTALSPAEAAALLAATMRTLGAEVSALGASLQAFHPAPGQWCVNEILGHLIEAERRGFAGRIRILLEQAEPRLETWNQDEVARARHDCAREGQALLDELGALRQASVQLAAGLTDQDLRRGGHHPTVGYLTVRDVLHEWVFHDRNHVKQALANVQQFVWPAMGNAQRFSST